MKFDKVTIIGVAVCVLSFFGIMWFQQRQIAAARIVAARTAPVAAQTAPESTAPAKEAASAEQQPAEQKSVEQQPVADPVAPVAATGVVSKYPLGPDLARESSSDVLHATLVRDGELTCKIDPVKGGIVSVTLSKYLNEKSRNGESSGNVELGSADYPYMTLGRGIVESLGLVDADPSKDLKVGDGFVELTRVNGSGDLRVVERWSVSSERSYEIDYSITMTSTGSQAYDLTGMVIDGGVISHQSTSGRRDEAGGAAYMPFDKSHCKLLDPKTLEKIGEWHSTIQNPLSLEGDRVKASEKIAGKLNGVAKWGALHSKYFLMSIWDQDGKGFARFDSFSCPEVDAGGKKLSRSRAKYLLDASVLPAGGTLEWSFRGYAGPKASELLHAMGNGMDGIMGMDRFFWGNPAWMGFISRMLLKCLVWFSQLIPGNSGYGWAVIFLTVLVKLLFWPLTHKSTKSMRKMQELKPQLDALKEQYKNDPQVMYRKQQELFKENNVSQLGGCLPMLLQIPVFFALFNTFRSAIELRQAGFLWAVDLSLPDTVLMIGGIGLNPLAILMGLTMVLQQKMTPNADPQQGRMMMMMSLVFIWIFYSMPAALTLYMTVNQLLSVLQAYLTKKFDDKKVAA